MAVWRVGKYLSNDSAKWKVTFLGVWQKFKDSIFLVGQRRRVGRRTDYESILVLVPILDSSYMAGWELSQEMGVLIRDMAGAQGKSPEWKTILRRLRTH